MKAFLLAGLAAAVPASATTPAATADELSTYVTARAADALGDPARAAQLFANLSNERPDDMSLRRRAVAGAILAGDMKLAIQLSRGMPIAQTPLDLRLLLVADELRAGSDKKALEILRTRQGIIDSSFLAPFVEAWTLAERRNGKALDALSQVTPGSALATQLNEQRALIYLKLKRPKEAASFAEAALDVAGGRADRLRLALADGFLEAGDRTQALAILEGSGPALAALADK
jgi:hypothetical protein